MLALANLSGAQVAAFYQAVSKNAEWKNKAFHARMPVDNPGMADMMRFQTCCYLLRSDISKEFVTNMMLGLGVSAGAMRFIRLHLLSIVIAEARLLNLLVTQENSFASVTATNESHYVKRYKLSNTGFMFLGSFDTKRLYDADEMQTRVAKPSKIKRKI